MIKQLKQFTINLVAGANVASILVMAASGYADRLHPADFPQLSTLGLFFPILLLVNLAFLLFWLAFKWRKMWIPIVGFLLVYFPITTYMPLNPPQDVPEGCIKIISYNVCAYGGNFKYEDAFDRVLDFFEQQQADIVCTQEDADPNKKYAFKRYEELYPHNDTTVFRKTKANYNGVGMHTRYPILRKERINYPSTSNGSVAYFLKRDKDTLLVINNHLESTHLSAEDRSNYREILKGEIEGDTARKESMRIIEKLNKAAVKRAVAVEAIRKYMEAYSQYPTIICGDFNDSPISYTRHALSEGLTDCYTESGRGIGLSYNRKGFWVRIDNILCSTDFTPYNCQILSQIDYSDHYPIVCWLKTRDK